MNFFLIEEVLRCVVNQNDVQAVHKITEGCQALSCRSSFGNELKHSVPTKLRHKYVSWITQCWKVWIQHIYNVEYLKSIHCKRMWKCILSRSHWISIADFCTKYIKQSRSVGQLLATNFAQCLVMLREQKSEQGQCIYHACFVKTMLREFVRQPREYKVHEQASCMLQYVPHVLHPSITVQANCVCVWFDLLLVMNVCLFICFPATFPSFSWLKKKVYMGYLARSINLEQITLILWN